VSDTDVALRVLSDRLENLCKDQSQLTTVAVLMAAQVTLEVLAEHRTAEPAAMVSGLEARTQSVIG
jgi:hypothetical protein